jgi:predicted RNA-binding protein YlqC (UPF0109 family)
MKDALLSIVSAIVENQDAIKIEEETQEDGTMNYVVTVAKEDMGRIIGKNGKVIRAIRTVMKIPAIKNNTRIFVTLAEIPQE